MVFHEGIVLVSERKLKSKLIIPKSIQKIHEIDCHIACAVSGLGADSNRLIDHAREVSAYHKFVYKESISTFAVTQSVSDLALNFGDGDTTTKEKPMARPFGCSMLIAGIDDKGPRLF